MTASEHPPAGVATGAVPGAPEGGLGPAEDPPVDRAADPSAEVTALPAADLSALPEQVRTRIVELGARTLGTLPSASVPSALLRVAKFTPAKRAKLGAAALAQVIGEDGSFRAAVAESARSLVDPSPDASGGRDDIDRAAAAFLLRLPEAGELLERVADAGRIDALRDRVADQERELMRLRSRLETVTAERDQLRDRLEQARPEAAAELEKLRNRLREQGSRVRAAELAAERAAAAAAATLAGVTADLERATSGLDDWRARYAAANDRAEANARALAAERDAAGAERAAMDRRVDLLLGTLEGAASGLRRELKPATGGPAPTDLVAAGLPVATPGRERAADPARLADWLALPNAHLIVDGYNVTKSGYPQLSLADQRDRLIRGLAGLAARTSAEITIVFDGAKVTTAQPAGRGIRVLFSPPGVIADDVIRRIVAAEPQGRVVIVASSDREVATAVVRDGARSVASAVLVEMLGQPGR